MFFPEKKARKAVPREIANENTDAVLHGARTDLQELERRRDPWTSISCCRFVEDRNRNHRTPWPFSSWKEDHAQNHRNLILPVHSSLGHINHGKTHGFYSIDDAYLENENWRPGRYGDGCICPPWFHGSILAGGGGYASKRVLRPRAKPVTRPVMPVHARATLIAAAPASASSAESALARASRQQGPHAPGRLRRRLPMPGQR